MKCRLVIMYLIIIILLFIIPINLRGQDGVHFSASTGRESKVHYGDLELTVPEGATDQDMTVTDTKLDLTGIQKPYGLIPIGNAYRFGPHGLQFKSKKALGFRLKINSNTIPKGFSLASVRLYYINYQTKQLELILNQNIDLKDGILQAKLEHFSDYVPGVIPGWDGKGLSPFADYVNNGEESVCLSNCELSIKSPVYSLPGRAGMDLNLNRVYHGYYNYISYKYDPFAISAEWSWDLPHFGFGLHMPGGACYSLSNPIKSNSDFTVCTYDQGIVCTVYNVHTMTPTIYLSDGTRIDVYSDYQQVTDTKGNYIRYNFTIFDPNTPIPLKKLTSLIDSAGRQFVFNYDSNYELTTAEQILSDGTHKTILTRTKSTTDSPYTYSESFTDVLNRTTTYHVKNKPVYDPNNKYPETYNIMKIDYFNGATSKYEYSRDSLDNIRVSKQSFFYPNQTTAYRTVNYTFTINETGIFYHYTGTTANDNTIIRSVSCDVEGHIVSESICDTTNKFLKNISYVYPRINLSFIDPLDQRSDFESYRPSRITTTYGKPDGTLGDSLTYYFQYDDWGNITQETDPYGNTTYMAYANTNSKQDLHTITSGGKALEDVCSNTGSWPKIYDLMLTKATFITDPVHGTTQVKQTHYWYNDNTGTLKKEQKIYFTAQGQRSELNTNYEYDAYGNIIHKTDAKGNQLWFTYPASYNYTYLNTVSLTNGGTPLTTYTYDMNTGRKLTATDPNQNLFSYTYDTIGRLTREKLNSSAPNVGVERDLNYDDLNNIVSIDFGNSSSWEHGKITYDALFGKPILIQRQINGSWLTIKQFHYDFNGRLDWEKDGKGNTTTHQYDVLNREIQTTLPDGSYTSYSWNNRNRTVSNNKGTIQLESYDLLDRLTRIDKYPNTNTTYTTTYNYDSDSHLIRTTNPRGAQTTNSYDNLGRLIKTDYPTQDSVPLTSDTFTYDNVGNLSTKTGANGTTNIDYEFYGDYRIRTVTEPGNRIISYTYDPNNNILTQTCPAATYTYSNYDARNRAHNLSAQMDSNTFNISYDYDLFGRIKSITYPGRTNAIIYNYDEMDRLQTIPGFINTACSYDLDNNLTEMNYANGVQNSYSYDAYERLNRIRAIRNGVNLLDLNYSYDSVDNINQINSNKYEYDNLNRLTWEGTLSSMDPNTTGMARTYDGAGNFSSKTIYANGTVQSSFSCSTDYSNRLKSMGPINLTYNNAGACTQKVNSSGTWNYTYDGECRLTQVTKNGAVVETNAYDGNGMRIKRVNNSKTTYYLYSGTKTLMEYSTNNGYKYHIYAGTKQIAEESGGVVKYLHTDHLGSVRAKTDVNGNLIRRSDFGAFGDEKPLPVLAFQDNFDTNSLSNWTFNNPHGASFVAQNGAVTITHTITPYSGDYIVKHFDNLKDVVFKFRVKLGSVNNDGCSLAVESNGFNMVFFANSLYYYNNGWQLVGLVPQDVWNSFKVVISATHLDIYINDQLKYSLDGTFSTKNYLAFRDYGLSSGVVVNYLDNVSVTNCDYTDSNYSGKQMDQDTNLVYFCSRWYDPELGRFLTQDPAKDGLNWYVYCNNNPINAIDPDGLAVYYVCNQMNLNGTPTINPISHSFIALTDSSGKVTHTYSWLPDDGGGWFANRGCDKKGAQAAIDQNIGATNVGDDSFNKYVEYAANLMKNQTGYNLVWFQCKIQAKNLIDLANVIKVYNEASPAEKRIILSYAGPELAKVLKESETINSTTSNSTTNNNTMNNTSNNSNISSDNNETDTIGGTGTTTGNQSIICVELFRQGLMDKNIFLADEKFGDLLKEKYPLVLTGYQFWARSVVANMKKSKVFTKSVYFFAKPWSYEMAHIMGYKEKGDLTGKLLMLIGVPLCWLIGIIITNPVYLIYIMFIFFGFMFYIRAKRIKVSIN